MEGDAPKSLSVREKRPDRKSSAVKDIWFHGNVPVETKDSGEDTENNHKMLREPANQLT